MERVNRCERCTTLYKTATESGICCVLGPEPSGWCVWCGNDLRNKKQVFCNIYCSVSYHQDLGFGGANNSTKFTLFQRRKTP